MAKSKLYGSFKSKGTHKNKSLIVLCHTSREVGEYLTSLKFRYNGNYDKIPNYVITREGEIIQLLEDKQYSDFFSDTQINEKSVIISLENLGWLEKKPLSNEYINWLGNIYKGVVFEKKWRDFFFWQPYTEVQMQKTIELSNKLLESLQIKKRAIGHNTKVQGVTSWEGIISRSNIDSKYTDLNPSFDFKALVNFFENEKHNQ